jgi:lysophospholipase L1-like esterase
MATRDIFQVLGRQRVCHVLLSALCTVLILSHTARANENFDLLKKAKRVVFLGDSITYGGEYMVYFERWLTVNHPELTLEVLNQGLPSETVSGLSEPGHMGYGFARPDLHERLDRALTALKPDLLIACYGINCGIYQALDEERFKRYRDGITRLEQAARKHRATIIFMTPPVYDKAGPNVDYDTVMEAYARWLVSKRADGWQVIDLYTVMKEALKEKRVRNPSFKYARDGVHPGDEGHALMAQQVIDFFAIKPPLKNPHPNAYGRMMMFLRERMRVMRDAWLTEIGHNRPKMKKGLPLAEAKKIAAENTERIQQNLRSILQP